MKVQTVRKVGSKALALLLCVTLMMGLNPASALATEISQPNIASANIISTSESLPNENADETNDMIVDSSDDPSTEESATIDNKTDSKESSVPKENGTSEKDATSEANEKIEGPNTSNGLIEGSNKEKASAEDVAAEEAALMALGLNATDTEEDASRTANTATATVNYNVQMFGMFGPLNPQLNATVRGDLAESYGYTDSVTNGVSVLDVLVDAHIRKYGTGLFTPQTAQNYLALSSYGSPTICFGISSNKAYSGFSYNDTFPQDEYGTGTTVSTQPVANGDMVAFFFYSSNYDDYLAWFCEDGIYTSSITTNGKSPIELSIKGFMYMYGFNNGAPISHARVGWVDIKTGNITECNAIADENGKVFVEPQPKEGSYYLTTFFHEDDKDDNDKTRSPLIMPLLKVTVDPDYVPPAKNPSGLSNLEVKSSSYDNFDYYVLALDPAFDTNTLKYTAGTLNYAEENKRILYVTATTISPTAQITATLNDGSTTVLTSGTQIVMADKPKPGMNKLVVTVTTDSGSTEYTVRVKMADPNAPSVPSNDDIEAATVSTGTYLPTMVTNPTFNSLAGEWAVIGQMRGEFDGADEFAATYAKNLATELARTNGVLNKNAYNTDYSRVVLALTACGYDVTDFAGYNLLQPLADIDAVLKQGINGPIWTLIALDSHAYDIPVVDSLDKTQTTREGLIAAIIDKQLDNGGWTFSGKSRNSMPLDIDMTAMALIALAPYANSSNPDAKAAVDKALAGISNYLNDPNNTDTIESLGPDSYAQLISALCACDIDLEDSRFGIDGKSPMSKLLTFANQDGSFSRTEGGSSDLRATEQSLLALIACQRYLNGGNSLYNMSDVAIDKHQAVIDPKPVGPEESTDPEQPNNPNDNNSQGSSTNNPTGQQHPLDNPPSPQGRTASLSAPQDNTSQTSATDQQESKDSIMKSNAKAIADTGMPLDHTEKGDEPSFFVVLGIALIALGVIGGACILTFTVRRKRSSLNR